MAVECENIQCEYEEVTGAPDVTDDKQQAWRKSQNDLQGNEFAASSDAD